MDYGPFRELLDVYVEDIFGCGAVDTTNFVFDHLHVVKSSGNEVCSKIHGSGHEDLLSWVLLEHVGNYSCKNFDFSCAWRTLNECDPLAAGTSDRGLLAVIVAAHAIGRELKLKITGSVKRFLW